MHQLGPEDDLRVEHVEQAIRADDPDELHPTAPRELLGDAEARVEESRLEAQPRGELRRRRTPERGVAVVGVVEVFEAAHPPGEVRETGEALAAEEALVEGVIEVLDDPLAPGLAEGHDID